MGVSRNRAYSNGDITVIWQASECVHATTCYRKLRSVFDPIKRPWINMNGAPTDKILEMIELCPSMALSFRWNDEAKNETETSKKLFRGSLEQILGRPKNDASDVQDHVATINIRPDGPVVVSGEFDIVDSPGGEPIGKWKMASLCRCGVSGNMPHCDGTHFKIGFKAK